MSQGQQGKFESRAFRLQSERVNGHHTVQLHGEMDLSVVGMVDREVRRVEETDAAKIVLDLDQLDFVDASGLRLLLRLNTRARDRLRVTRGRPGQVRRMLELTGVDEILRFAD
jgi:anti-sigma B factor antagonist